MVRRTPAASTCAESVLCGHSEGRQTRALRTNPNAKGSNGYTAIHIAAINNRGEIITELARRGADVNLRASHGETAFELAIRGAQPEALESLLAAHATVVPIDNEEPLQFATKRFFDSEAGVRERGGDPHYDSTLRRMSEVITALRHHGV